jgi:hypothetical protein
MKTYFNTKTNGETETVDELDSVDFTTFRDFLNERRRLLKEYHLAGMHVYRSQRCTKDWAAR